jgi:hypothetical protein
MISYLILQIFSDSIKSNNYEYDKIINMINSLNWKSYQINQDSLERLKTLSIVKGYKMKLFRFENIIETFKSVDLDGQKTTEKSDSKDVEIYIFYENNNPIIYVVKEAYNGLNPRVYINLYTK